MVSMELSGNDLQAAAASGALDNIPQSTANVMLEYGGLNSVPASFTRKHPEITLLSMANNAIRTLKNGDFSIGNKLSTVNLADNPIVTIEDDALKYLSNAQYLNLQRSALVSLDLSVFNGMNQVFVLLDGSYLLKGLTVSDVNKVPKAIQISAKDTVLLTMDPKIAILLANPTFTLDISNNKNIDCNQDIVWMAKHVLCKPFNLRVDNTQCTPASGGNSLYSYLYQRVPNVCDEPTASTTTRAFTTMTFTTTPRIQPTTTTPYVWYTTSDYTGYTTGSSTVSSTRIFSTSRRPKPSGCRCQCECEYKCKCECRCESEC